MHRSPSTVVCSVACLTALLLGLPPSTLLAGAPHRETVAPGPTAPPVRLVAVPTGPPPDAQRPSGKAPFADRMPTARPAPNAGRPAVRHRVPADPWDCAAPPPGERRPLPAADCHPTPRPAPGPTSRGPRTV
ncbi:hypothetical protein ACWEQL_28715 [Kitasatospora sp. NPDC004240]